MVRKVSDGGNQGSLVGHEGKKPSLSQLSESVNKVGLFTISKETGAGITLRGHVTQTSENFNFFLMFMR